MNTSILYAKIDGYVDAPQFDRMTFLDWVEDAISDELGRPLKIKEMQVIAVAYYAGALRACATPRKVLP